MIITVLGIKHSKGDFNTPDGKLIAYDNYLLHHQVSNTDDMIGSCYGSLKVSGKALDKFLKDTGLGDTKMLLNKKMNFDFDPNGRLIGISMIR